MYFNRDLKKLKLDKKQMLFLKSGGCAEIFHDKDIIFKHYFSHTEDKYKLTPALFDIIKDIDNPHFMKIYDIYSKLSQIICNNITQRPFIVDAYIAKYYDDDSINVLDEYIDYILDNFRELEILFGIFSDNGIVTDDLARENIILNPNGMIIVDPDTFSISNLQKEDVIIINKSNLLALFKDICFTASLAKSNQFGMYPKDFHSKVFFEFYDMKIEENIDVSYQIYKKFKQVKRPIELFHI